jgi:hypothetical protein
MVLYICNKCNKNFNRKQSYQAHINRKYSCILTENLNTNLELEKNNKQYEEKCNKLEIELFNLKKDFELLINKIKELETENKQSEL